LLFQKEVIFYVALTKQALVFQRMMSTLIISSASRELKAQVTIGVGRCFLRCHWGLSITLMRGSAQRLVLTQSLVIAIR
jgi:hypothetical protein